jgi:DNA-binding SARP family transcriptional activator/predicted ATPase
VSELRLHLLGAPGASVDGRPAPLRRRASLVLLAYLALTGRRYPRPVLAGLLAGEASAAQAQKRLTNALADLRAGVGDHLQVTRQWVAFDRARPHWLDVAEFEARVADCADPRAAPAAAAAALGLYQGEFLAGAGAGDAPELDEWLTLQRERLRLALAQALQAALQAALEGCLRGGPGAPAPAAGIALARRLLELEPWSEEGHRALMALLARSGQRGAALRQYEVCRRALAEEVGAAPAPETAALAARLRAGPVAVAHNLPAPAAPLVGREGELALVAGRLADPACRLVTLAGLGGSGKTALALEAARRLAAPAAGPGEPPFPDGVFAVPLGAAGPAAAGPAAAGPARVGAAVARALGVGAGGAGDPLAAAAGHLRAKRLLLVVDGLDGPGAGAGAGALGALLQQAAGVKLLVTSRARLRLPGETVCDVRGLPVPAGAADLERSAAGRLFLEEAARVRPGAPLAGAERAAAAEVCRLLGGHPLALLTAAGSLRGVTCAELAADLAAGRGLPAEAATARGLLAGQTGLGAVLDDAWTSLTDAERDVLRRLVVFRRPFSREEAAAVAGAGAPELLGLVDAGLLGRLEDGRYVLNALVHRFAAGQSAAESDGEPGTPAASVPAGPVFGATLGAGLSRLGEALRLLAEAIDGAPAPGTERDAERDGYPVPGRKARRRGGPLNACRLDEGDLPPYPRGRHCTRPRASASRQPTAPGGGSLPGGRGQGLADERGPPRGRGPLPRLTADPPGVGDKDTKEIEACSVDWVCAAAERRSRSPPAHRKGPRGCPRRGRPRSWETASRCSSACSPSGTTSTSRTPAASGCSGSTARPCGSATPCTSRTCRATSGTRSRRSSSASASR